MIIMIDNYDSFTYNLVQYLRQMGREVVVYRNDEFPATDMTGGDIEAIFLSPGPGGPREAGVTVEVIRRFYRDIPLMGVCLGHQAIGYAFGGEVTRAQKVMHGKTSSIHSDGRTIFRGLPNPFTAGRYHSLIVRRDNLPSCLEVSAETEEGEIMGLRHREYPVEGIQFHPESILTPQGKRILRNFLNLAEGVKNRAQAA
ncbi:MAG: aminodeoxychorismate/anthranilate synthase component II [Pseudomonadota bacterium]|nr:aminodeoxychorismate/anthranilate synthase component II [Pseudomonadota bacterium]